MPRRRGSQVCTRWVQGFQVHPGGAVVSRRSVPRTPIATAPLGSRLRTGSRVGAGAGAGAGAGECQSKTLVQSLKVWSEVVTGPIRE